jgi:hypothetical protein
MTKYNWPDICIQIADVLRNNPCVTYPDLEQLLIDNNMPQATLYRLTSMMAAGAFANETGMQPLKRRFAGSLIFVNPDRPQEPIDESLLRLYLERKKPQE